jgi:hypothetical protein
VTRWRVTVTFTDGRPPLVRVLDLGERKGTELSALQACVWAASLCHGLPVAGVTILGELTRKDER